MEAVSEVSDSNSTYPYIIYGEEVHRRHHVAPDGNCGFTAFGITREGAYTILRENINAVRDILKPILSETLRTNEDFAKSLPADHAGLKNTSRDYFEAANRRDNASTNIKLAELEVFANDLNLIDLYITYDVKEKNIDDGWCHPLILTALAHIRKLNLCLYILDSTGKMLPHPLYHTYNTPEANETVHLLFINRNHFERLELVSRNELNQFLSAQEACNTDNSWLNNQDDITRISFLQKAKASGHLKSIKIKQFHNSLPAGFFWNDISMFTVITGTNGVGKSQLFLAICQGFENLLARQHFPIEVNFNDNEIPHICAISSATSNVRNQLVADSEKDYEGFLNSMSKDFYKYFITKATNQPCEVKNSQDLLLYQEFQNSKLFPQYTEGNYQYEIESRFKIFLLTKFGVHASYLGDVTKLANLLLSDFGFTIDTINTYLKKYGFKYQLDPNTINKAGPNPRMCFTNPEPHQSTIDYGWLSPGETLKLQTILWIIYTEKVNTSHKSTLLLLDEPDAHLEPSLTKEYFDLLMNFVIGQLGFQVIMTTHRPTSLCLLPLEVIHTLERRDNGTLSIRPNKTRREAIETLTSGFVNVNDKFRIVYVEADDDVKFYTTIQDQLIRANLLPKLYQVVYKSFGKERPDGKSDDSSCDTVQRLVNSMTLSTRDSSLIDFIFGIIDNDSKDEQRTAVENSPNLLVPQRYAIENYLLDPINLYYFLKKHRAKGKFSDILAKVGHTPETLAELLTLEDPIRVQVLQKIIDAITLVIEEKITMVFSANEQSLSKEDINLKKSLSTLLQKERFLNLNISNLLKRDKIPYIMNITLTIPVIWTKLRGKNLKHLLVCALEIEKGPKLKMSQIISSLTQNDGMILIPLEVFEIIRQLQVNIPHNALEKLHKPIERETHEKLKNTASGLQAENKKLTAKLAKKDHASESFEKKSSSKTNDEPEDKPNTSSWLNFFKRHGPGFAAGIVATTIVGTFLYKTISDGGNIPKP